MPAILVKVSTDFVQQTCNYLEINLEKMHVARNNFSLIKVAVPAKGWAALAYVNTIDDIKQIMQISMYANHLNTKYALFLLGHFNAT